MKEYLDKIQEFKDQQQNLCSICKCEIEKPYLDADMNEGLAFSVTCFECYAIMSECNYEIDHLKKIIKYLKFRDNIYAQNAHKNQ